MWVGIGKSWTSATAHARPLKMAVCCGRYVQALSSHLSAAMPILSVCPSMMGHCVRGWLMAR